MKQSLTSVLIILLFTLQIFSQTGKCQIPNYHTELIENVNINKVSLTINYVTIDKNIKASSSSDTARKTPTLEEYITFARNIPSYQFCVIKKSDTLFTISYLQKNEGDKTTFYYEVIDLKKNQTQLVESKVWGEITEKRVDEMIFYKYDSESKKGAILGTNPRQFLFDNMIYGYQDYEKLKYEITELAKQLIKQ